MSIDSSHIYTSEYVVTTTFHRWIKLYINYTTVSVTVIILISVRVFFCKDSQIKQQYLNRYSR